MIIQKQLIEYLRSRGLNRKLDEIVKKCSSNLTTRKELYQKLFSIIQFECRVINDEIEKFVEILMTSTMITFLAEYRVSSEDLITKLFYPVFIFVKSTSAKINQNMILLLMKKVATKKYHTMLSMFYIPPASAELHFSVYKTLFDIHFKLGSEAADAFLETLYSQSYFNFIKRYKTDEDYHLEVLRLIIKVIAQHLDSIPGRNLLALLQSDSYEIVCEHYGDKPKPSKKPVSKNLNTVFDRLSFYVKDFPYNEMLRTLFQGFASSKLIKRQKNPKNKFKAYDNLLYMTLLGVDRMALNNLFTFTREYLRKGYIETLIYDKTMQIYRTDLNGIELGKYLVSLFISGTFKKVYYNYGNLISLMEFIVNHIFDSILNRDKGIYQRITSELFIRLILQERLDRDLIIRYRYMFNYAKNNAGSRFLENQFMEYMYHLYIYQILEKYITSKNIRIDMTRVGKFYSSYHKKLENEMDIMPMTFFQSEKLVEKKPEYKAKVERWMWFARQDLIDGILSSAKEKHKNVKLSKEEQIFHLKYLIFVAMKYKCEDELYAALPDVLTQGDLHLYRRYIDDLFFENPDKNQIRKAFHSREYCSVSFDEASRYFYPMVWLLIGNYPVIPMKDGQAFTDNVNIAIPEKFSYFIDPKIPLDRNRNLSLFISVVVHEVYHIRAKSFMYNLNDYVETLKIPELFFYVWNICEDFRIESYARKENIVQQINALLILSNTHFASIGEYSRSIEDIMSMIMFKIIAGCLPGEFDEKKESYEIRLLNTAITNKVMLRNGFSYVRDVFRKCVSIGRNINIDDPADSIKAAAKIYDIIEPLYLKNINLEKLAAIKGQPLQDKYIFIPRTDEDESGMSGAGIAVSEGEEGKAGQGEDENDAGNNGKGESKGDNNLTSIPIKDLRDLDKLNIDPEKINPEISLTDDYWINDIRTPKKSKVEGPRHTNLDDHLLEYKNSLDNTDYSKKNGSKTEEKAVKKKKKKVKVKSYSSSIGRFIDIQEINHNLITHVNESFLNMAGRYEYLIDSLQEMIHLFKLKQKRKRKLSRTGVELNVEKLMEVMLDDTNFSDLKILEEFAVQEVRPHIIIGFDASGSTGAKASPVGKSVMDIEKIFSILFSRVLEQVSAKLQIFAFDSMTSTNIYEFPHWKNVSGMKPGGNNRDGDFLRYINYCFSSYPFSKRYFFFCSDGYPSAQNYFGEEALIDTALAMRELKGNNVKIAYFNVDLNLNQADNYYDLLANECHYSQHFSSPDQLLTEIPKIGKALLKNILSIY